VSTDGAWESEKKMCCGVQMALTRTSVPQVSPAAREMDGEHQTTRRI